MSSSTQSGLRRKSTDTSTTAEIETGGTPYQSVGINEYLELRQRSNSLIRKRPRLKQNGSAANDENWSYFLENVFTEAELAVRVLMDQETNNYRPVINSIAMTMVEKLLTVGKNMVDIYSMNERCNCVVQTCVVEFWSSVSSYLTDLFTWAEVEIVKILLSKVDSRAIKRKAIQDIFDQAQDLLWGIYT